MIQTRFLGIGLIVTLALGLAGATARPILKGGIAAGGGTGGGTAYAIDVNGTGLRADFSAGQAFISWPGLLDGSSLADYTKRFRAYRTLGLATNLSSCTSGTLIAK